MLGLFMLPLAASHRRQLGIREPANGDVNYRDCSRFPFHSACPLAVLRLPPRRIFPETPLPTILASESSAAAA